MMSYRTKYVPEFCTDPLFPTYGAQGFYIRLDGRELLVRSCFGDRKFRVPQEGKIREIEEAVVYDLSGGPSRC